MLFLVKKENGLLCEIDKKYKTLCGLQGIFRGKRYQRSVYMIAVSYTHLTLPTNSLV